MKQSGGKSISSACPESEKYPHMNKLLFEELELQGHDAVILEITLPLLSGRLTTFTPWLACRPSVLIREARSQNPRGVIRWLAFRVFAILSPSLLLLTQLLTRHSTRGREGGPR